MAKKGKEDKKKKRSQSPDDLDDFMELDYPEDMHGARQDEAQNIITDEDLEEVFDEPPRKPLSKKDADEIYS